MFAPHYTYLWVDFFCIVFFFINQSLKILATHQEPIDLLLTDLMLPPPSLEFATAKNPYPRVHGHDVIERTLAIKKAFRVILMSSLSEQERTVYKLVTDHVPFLQKPFSVETLIQLVHLVLASAPLRFDESAITPPPKQDVRWYG